MYLWQVASRKRSTKEIVAEMVSAILDDKTVVLLALHCLHRK